MSEILGRPASKNQFVSVPVHQRLADHVPVAEPAPQFRSHQVTDVGGSRGGAVHVPLELLTGTQQFSPPEVSAPVRVQAPAPAVGGAEVLCHGAVHGDW